MEKWKFLYINHNEIRTLLLIEKGESLMTKAMKKAISDINMAIIERKVDNFLDEFDDESNTSYFVKNCLTENQLDINKMQEFSDEQQKDYVYNILVFWYGMPAEQALKRLRKTV